MRLAVRLTPRGGRDAIDGWASGPDGRPYLKVRVSAPPVEGEANAALTALLAKALGVSKSSVRIAAGQSGRLKSVEIEGLSEADLTAAFGPRPAGQGDRGGGVDSAAAPQHSAARIKDAPGG